VSREQGAGSSVEEASDSTAIPRTVKGLALVSLFNDFASEMVYPLLPAFVVGTLGGSATMLSAVDGAAELTASVAKWSTGALSDRPGWRKPLILAGYFCAVLVRPFMAVAQAAWQVVGFRVIDRLGKGIRTPARDAMISDVTPPALRGRAFGFHAAADHLGSIPGSLLAWWLLSRSVEVRRVLEWSVVPGVVAFVVLAFVLRGNTDGRDGQDGQGGQAGQVAANLNVGAPADSVGKVFWLPVLSLTALALFRLPETLLLLRLQQLGIAVATIPLIWAGLHLVRTLASYPGGWVSDHIVPRHTILAGAALFAVIALLMAQSLTASAAITVFLGLGLVTGLTESAERVVVTRLAPRKTGRGFGTYHAAVGFAALPASLLFGAVYQIRGGSVALRLSAVLLILTAVTWALSARSAATER
jgi:MFS family permease